MNTLTKFLFICTATGLFFALTPKAYSLAPMSAQELSNLCKTYQDNDSNDQSIQCARYIKGFIDGILAIKQSSHRLQETDDATNSFVKRAIKTRIGNRIKQQEPLYTKQFCLGDDPSLHDVVTNVTNEISQSNHQDATALIAVYRALSRNFPCEKTS